VNPPAPSPNATGIVVGLVPGSAKSPLKSPDTGRTFVEPKAFALIDVLARLVQRAAVNRSRARSRARGSAWRRSRCSRDPFVGHQLAHSFQRGDDFRQDKPAGRIVIKPSKAQSVGSSTFLETDFLTQTTWRGAFGSMSVPNVRL
jgi:hypothetical protein